MDSKAITDFIVKWTPRLIAVGIGGYYGLGIAYEAGLMAIIDKIAIQIIKHVAGYAGIGALMPTVQWYSAWGVRCFVGVSVAVFYDTSEKLFCFFSQKLNRFWSIDDCGARSCR